MPAQNAPERLGTPSPLWRPPLEMCRCLPHQSMDLSLSVSCSEQPQHRVS